MRINKKKLKALLDKYNIETLEEALGYIKATKNCGLGYYLCRSASWRKKHPKSNIDFDENTTPFSGLMLYDFNFSDSPADASDIIFSSPKLTAQLKRALKAVYNE